MKGHQDTGRTTSFLPGNNQLAESIFSLLMHKVVL